MSKSIYWCNSCEIPIIEKSICPRCGSKCRSASTNGICNPVFYQEKDFIGFAHLKMLIPKKNTLPDFDGLVGRYIAVSIRKSISGRYNYTTKLNTGNILRTKISLPCKDGLVDTDFIRKIMTEEQKRSAGLVLDYLRSFSEQ